MNSATKTAFESESPDFSPTLGGPLFQLYVRSHLSNDALGLLKRRILVITGIAWLPLLFLALAERGTTAASGALPFWMDIEVHAKLLIALPLLVGAELFVHRRLFPLAKRLVDRQVVTEEDIPKFKSAVTSALRARNSVGLEVLLLVLVYTAGVWFWHSQMALSSATWYEIPDRSHFRLTAAGIWYAFVSVPMMQFILLRWYVRIVIWFWLLWRISRFNLHLVATHPDRAGGIGFIGESSKAFLPLLFAQGCMMSGKIANWVMYQGDNLMNFKLEVGFLVVFLVVFILGPLLIFAPKLEDAKRRGSAEYGLLASNYVLDFQRKWIRRESTANVELLGTSDIQSLADMANSYAVVREMRIVPFGSEVLMYIIVATAAPLVPLALLVMPFHELLKRLMKLFF